MFDQEVCFGMCELFHGLVIVRVLFLGFPTVIPILFFPESKSKPVLASDVSQTFLVLTPPAEEVDRAIRSLLEDCPTSSGCYLITEHLKRTPFVWVYLVYSIISVPTFKDIGTVRRNYGFQYILFLVFVVVIKQICVCTLRL